MNDDLSLIRSSILRKGKSLLTLMPDFSQNIPWDFSLLPFNVSYLIFDSASQKSLKSFYIWINGFYNSFIVSIKCDSRCGNSKISWGSTIIDIVINIRDFIKNRPSTVLEVSKMLASKTNILVFIKEIDIMKGLRTYITLIIMVMIEFRVRRTGTSTYKCYHKASLKLLGGPSSLGNSPGILHWDEVP